MPHRLLALDTATDTVHLGLSTPEGEWLRALPGGAAASTGLLPAIEALLLEAGLGLAALDAIAFGRGPGAFTGLRTACAIAQGLAFGAARPLIGLDTLAAVADDAAAQGAGEAVWAVTDARMGEVYAARWARVDGAWQADQAVGLYAPEAFWAQVPALQAAAEGQPAWPEAVPRAASLLRLARAAQARGEFLDPALALPLYVRNKVAQTTEERARLGRA
jgi:tRNA threonylcarbamoyladenosine biosynthesis protein TsaB